MTKKMPITNKSTCDHKKALRYKDDKGREKIRECFKCGHKE